MFKKDLDLIWELHSEFRFGSPLLDAGGLECPTIADYDISAKKAYKVKLNLGGIDRDVVVPHEVQTDRYVALRRPWSFIDSKYVIENPVITGRMIEDLPAIHPNKFATVIMVSVLEHVSNPYKVSDALFAITKPGGYLIDSTPFLFPHHPSPEDNFRFSPEALKRIHESSGFKWIRGGFHVNYLTTEGVGDTNPERPLAPQAIMASYALCQKP
jgi:SAM-dependent methyltransferase